MLEAGEDAQGLLLIFLPPTPKQLLGIRVKHAECEQGSSWGGYNILHTRFVFSSTKLLGYIIPVPFSPIDGKVLN